MHTFEIMTVIYYALFDLRYHCGVEKTAAAKRLGAEKNIFVREVERRLDATLFPDEIPRWEPSRPHCPFLYQRMFPHEEAPGRKEHDQGICCGCQQSLPERDVQAEVPTMEL